MDNTDIARLITRSAGAIFMAAGIGLFLSAMIIGLFETFLPGTGPVIGGLPADLFTYAVISVISGIAILLVSGMVARWAARPISTRRK